MKLATTINVGVCGIIKYCFLGLLLWVNMLLYVFIIAANVRYVSIDTNVSLLGKRPPGLAFNHYSLIFICIFLVSTINTEIIFINEHLLVSDFFIGDITYATSFLNIF